MTALWFALMTAALLMVCAYLDQREQAGDEEEPVEVPAQDRREEEGEGR